MYKGIYLLSCVILFFALPSILQSVELSENRPPSPPTGVRAFDTPNDAGSSITIQWAPPKNDSLLLYYEVMKSTEKQGKYEIIAKPSKLKHELEDTDVKDGKKYYYFIRAIFRDGEADSKVAGPAISSQQWFHHKHWNVLVLGLIFGVVVIWYIRRARKGESLYIRRVAGLEAVDEAVGRSTEMGKPIMFILGLGDMTEVATLAGLSILGRVAKKAAEYGTPLIVPCADPVVMSTAQEVVREAHVEAGRPDTFKESSVFFLSYDQFGYAAGCDGIMLREKPGAIFLQGYFYAESLVLAETGHSIGAIQIAGTSAATQLPFFIAACDYTLIGEELFAASAYLSREPLLLGSLKGEDLSKVIILVLIGIGIVLVTLQTLAGGGIASVANKFISWFSTF